MNNPSAKIYGKFGKSISYMKYYHLYSIIQELREYYKKATVYDSDGG